MNSLRTVFGFLSALVSNRAGEVCRSTAHGAQRMAQGVTAVLPNDSTEDGGAMVQSALSSERGTKSNGNNRTEAVDPSDRRRQSETALSGQRNDCPDGTMIIGKEMPRIP